MASSNDQSESRSGWRLKPWQGRLIAALLIVGGVLHAFKPSLITLDWQSIAVILLGILLLFLPLDDVGSVIESLEVGKTKILFRKVQQLDDTVEQAIHADIKPSNRPLNPPKPGEFTRMFGQSTGVLPQPSSTPKTGDAGSDMGFI